MCVLLHSLSSIESLPYTCTHCTPTAVAQLYVDACPYMYFMNSIYIKTPMIFSECLSSEW